MLRDSVVVVVRTGPRAIPLAMITMRKSTHGFPVVSHIWVAYGAPLGGPSGRRSSAMKTSAHLALEGVIHLGLRSRWITPSFIWRILHILLSFIQ